MAGVGAFGWKKPFFRVAYANNRLVAKGIAAEDSPIVPALRRFIDKEGDWRGRATRLLEQLNSISSGNERKQEFWPATPAHLSGELMRLAPVLRAEAIHITRGRRPGDQRERFIEIRRVVGDTSD